MDTVISELIGKPKLNTAKIITVIAENFSLFDDQARFILATLAIPIEKQSPIKDLSKHIVQVGPVHTAIRELLEEQGDWHIDQIDPSPVITCDSIDKNINIANGRSLIYINDLTSLLYCLDQDWSNLLKLISRWRSVDNSFVICLAQNNDDLKTDTFLRNLQFISDAVIRVEAMKDLYFQKIWYQPIQDLKVLIPAKVITCYFTSKIGKSNWSGSEELLCFHDRVQVDKSFDVEEMNTMMNVADLKVDSATIDDDELSEDDRTSTLPYVRAQNAEQAKIFYYRDEDDFDEDDPDYDLDI